ncbi:MFS transporter [Actinacidiphila glaucinigra]|uniref:MFS transporter n=1 Tax=Actinacidiphila glaucinigra TaxID=235986 RepID=UPI0037C83879
MSDRLESGQEGPEVNPGLVLLLCSGATFMAFLDLSVVNIAFPKIIEKFPDTGMATLTWVVSGYAVMFAAVLTPAGRLADTVGRTRVFLWSLTGFTLASLACGAATGPEWLIVARFAQGALAAGMIPSALSLIMSSTPLEKLIKAIGTWSAVAGFSAVVGPAIGGVLVEQMSWRAVFYINVPIGVLLAVAGLRALPRHRPATGSRLPDVVGTASLALGIGLVVASLTEGDSWGWTSARTLGLLAGGLALGAFAVLRSRRHASPAIATELWKSRKYAVVNGVSAVFGVSMFAWLLAGALFATGVWHWSIMEAAGAMSVGAVASMVTSTIAGRASEPAAHRRLVILGALMFAACTSLMGSDFLGPDPDFWGAWVPTGLLGGGGLGFAVTSLSSIAATALPPLQFAAGVGMNLTARQIGGALGTAMLAAIMAAHSAPGIDAFHDLYRVCTAVTVVAALAALGLTDRTPAAVPRQEAGAQTPAEVSGS